MQYFGEPEGRVKIQMMSKNLQWYYTLKRLIRDLLSNVLVSSKFWLAKVFDLSRSRGNETSTNIVWYLYSFRTLFVLYEAVLDNKHVYDYSVISEETSNKNIHVQHDFTLFFMFLARLAYLSVFRVSMKSRSDGEIHAIMRVRL